MSPGGEEGSVACWDGMQGLGQLQDLLAASGRSAKTARDYSGALERLDRWARGQGFDAATLPPRMIQEYVDSKVPLTRSARLHVRQGLKWYREAMGAPDGAHRAVRVPSEDAPVCRALEPGEARRLFRAAVEWERGGEGVAVLLGQQMGLRAAEIASLEWAGFSGDWSRVRFVGKGPKEATLPVHPIVRGKLEWWRGWGGELPPTDPRARPGRVHVFAGSQGRRHIHPATVWTWVRRLGGSVGVTVTTHQLRHTFGAEVNDVTRDLRATQRLLRHSRSTTTERYTRVTWSRMIEAQMAADYTKDLVAVGF